MIKQKKKEVNKDIVITAIICLAALEICAMMMGINGTVRTIIFTMIGTLAGLSLPTPNILKGGTNG